MMATISEIRERERRLRDPNWVKNYIEVVRTFASGTAQQLDTFREMLRDAEDLQRDITGRIVDTQHALEVLEYPENVDRLEADLRDLTIERNQVFEVEIMLQRAIEELEKKEAEEEDELLSAEFRTFSAVSDLTS